MWVPGFQNSPQELIVSYPNSFGYYTISFCVHNVGDLGGEIGSHAASRMNRSEAGI